jgi:hypothetical protein
LLLSRQQKYVKSKANQHSLNCVEIFSKLYLIEGYEINRENRDREQIDREIHDWEKTIEYEIDREHCDWEQVDREIRDWPGEMNMEYGIDGGGGRWCRGGGRGRVCGG